MGEASATPLARCALALRPGLDMSLWAHDPHRKRKQIGTWEQTCQNLSDKDLSRGSFRTPIDCYRPLLPRVLIITGNLLALATNPLRSLSPTTRLLNDVNLCTPESPSDQQS